MRLLAIAALAALIAVGCSGETATTTPAGGPTGKQGMEDLGQLLKTVAEQKKAPPAKAAELEPYDAVYLSATLSVTRGEVVYVWGSGLTGGPAVIAYEKDAATSGGYVLLQDGTVKSMTAAEFAAAPKAGKK